MDTDLPSLPRVRLVLRPEVRIESEKRVLGEGPVRRPCRGGETSLQERATRRVRQTRMGRRKNAREKGRRQSMEARKGCKILTPGLPRSPRPSP
eukprot:758879-Hanusia_phi.AAC.2